METKPKEEEPVKDEPKIIGYLWKNNGIKGPGFREWSEPIYDKPLQKKNEFTI